MKRILTAGVLFLCVTMFFTGCSSIIIQDEFDPADVHSSVSKESLSIEQTSEGVPDYYQLNSRIKFSDEEAAEAFQIKSGHSKKTADIEDFQIVDLLNGKTFVYGYVTLAERKENHIVHCGAFYNYKTKELNVFHENEFKRTGKEESFHIQMCTSMNGDPGGIFVYDNGMGYLYNKDGELIFYADIESFIRRQYSHVFSVSVAQAFTDGENRIYMDLVIEKTEIEIPETIAVPKTLGSDETEEEVDEEEEKKMEKEAEEIETKIENAVLVYETHSLKTTLNQENSAFAYQMMLWTKLTENKEFARDNPPDAEKDWETIKKNFPDTWEQVHLHDYKNLPVYEWKGKEQFINKSDSLCTFEPQPGSFQNFKNLQEGMDFKNHFFHPENGFSMLYGKCGELKNCGEDTFSRSVTLYWEEEKPNEAGETVSVKQTQTITQTLTKDSRQRKAPLENGYYETYAVLDSNKVTELGDSIQNELIGSNKDGKVYWIKSGKPYTEANVIIGEDDQVSIFRDGKLLYLLVCNMKTGQVKMFPDTVHKEHTPPSVIFINYKNLPGVATEGTSAEDESFQEEIKKYMPEGLNVYDSGYLTKDNILISSLNLEQSKSIIQQLLWKDSKLVWAGLLTNQQISGCLLTNPNLGIIFYDCLRRKGLPLVEGTWYRSWKVGNQYVSVGFADSDSIYELKDAAFAKVYQYSLDDVANRRLQIALDAILKEENDIKESSAAQSLEDMTSTEPLEGVEDPMDWWNREYQKKYDSSGSGTSAEE